MIVPKNDNLVRIKKVAPALIRQKGCKRNQGKRGLRTLSTIAIVREFSAADRISTLAMAISSGQFPFLNEGCKPLPRGGHVLKHGLHAFIRGRFSQAVTVRGALAVPFDLFFAVSHGSFPLPHA
jgi:hypothetical protein